jgi:hypothetical protein
VIDDLWKGTFLEIPPPPLVSDFCPLTSAFAAVRQFSARWAVVSKAWKKDGRLFQALENAACGAAAGGLESRPVCA